MKKLAHFVLRSHGQVFLAQLAEAHKRPDSDVDILVGYSKDADVLHDICGSINWLTDNLSDVLGREVDVVPYVENCEMGYVHMEALLTTKTIWGDASWLVASRDTAEKTLREGYTRTKNVREIWLHVRERVLSDVVRDDSEVGGRLRFPGVSSHSH